MNAFMTIVYTRVNIHARVQILYVMNHAFTVSLYAMLYMRTNVCENIYVQYNHRDIHMAGIAHFTHRHTQSRLTGTSLARA